ncbi:MAG: anhydro-N-acetylmuramic acid kinase [Bacteroidetes bacterium]|nr:anhydro-N-acetylmuramic acid kinase [Bacteroidota bacterium]
MEKDRVIGLMSGSSLDGLDIAYCEFHQEDGNWNFKILKTDVIVYPDEWIQEIKHLPVASAKTLWQTHAGLGNYFGEQVNVFIKKYALKGKVDFVASHGHTIFHFPEKRFTTQIGDGAAIAARTNLPVVCDFRSADIADGGQGTPIVPIGDLLLFKNYPFCLNIGGIANMSCKVNDSIVAFDVCSANQVMNSLANRLGKDFDENGQAAASGNLNEALLERLNGLEYYKQAYPKSLDNSFSREMIFPLIEDFDISTEDKLNTFSEHVAQQVAAHVALIARKEKAKFGKAGKILATGGGAFNKFLIERIRDVSKMEVEVPNDELVKYKEALVIAFMGALRMRYQNNILKSVTGATKDSMGGGVYRP